MKKLLLIAALAIGLLSCKKDEVKPEPSKNCKCFTVTKKETFNTVEGFPLPQVRGWERLTLQNVCDRQVSTRVYTPTQVLNIRIGDQICD